MAARTGMLQELGRSQCVRLVVLSGGARDENIIGRTMSLQLKRSNERFFARHSFWQERGGGAYGAIHSCPVSKNSKRQR